MNQQVTIKLSAANFDFAHSSGRDVRFTDGDGTTLLSHWTDVYNATSHTAVFVVRVPALPASTATTIYMYYGNSNAAAGSSGARTFAFYDGFERLRNGAALQTPTYDRTGQATHPDVVHFPGGWHGFRYWMANTPYPGSNDRRENPSILASNDGLHWSVPAGVVNPLVPPPPCDHNNDPDMLYNEATGELWMYYLDTRRAVPSCNPYKNQPWYNHNYLKLIRSSDGVHWTAPVVVNDWSLATQPLYISPALVKRGSTFTLWMVNKDSKKVRTAQSANGLHFSVSRVVSLANKAWHINVEYIAARNEYWMFLDFPSTPEGNIRFARSTDGVNWTTYPNPALTYRTGSWDSSLYRSSFTFDAATNQLRLWYSAHSASKVWRIGHSSVDYADLVNQLVAGGGWRREQGTGTWSTSTSPVLRGALSARLIQSTGTSMWVSKPQPLANGLFLESNVYDDLDRTAFKMVRLTSAADKRVGVGVWTGASANRYVFHGTNFRYTASSVTRTRGWHRFGVLLKPDGSVAFSVDGRTVGTVTGQFTNAAQVQVEGYAGGTTGYNVDDLRVRRWTGPEPTTSIGAEESR